METEFFGCEKHAFTGAARMHRGRLARADGSDMKPSELLGISRKTVRDKMKKHKVESGPGSGAGHAQRPPARDFE